ncbi:outer membrane immunogenic protein [Altererythrobacter atlanticus]|uniref:Outer membrane protein A n=1 Tax=Croceibacterium atlanticum TaxID=1267766 RepID=A0A0F7KVH7_9SPHN|nr:outer membrane beta-barrel protein [Croceibacterium atlanticum]AKH44333.1 outer membrane protein A [Croceibacterium atlanticum]MBB5733951.1 outer membrane immunogenic protein [Croceibacterium atlanticum]
MKRFMLVGAAIAALSTAPAAAQEFQGPYVGAQAGWNQDKAVDGKQDAFVGGVFAGYDHEVAPNVVLGVEGGFSLGASDRIGPNGADNASLDPRYSFDASARAGYVLGERNLLYVRGGYANTRARLTQDISGVAVRSQDNYDGWFVGGGVERKLLDNVSTRVEYRYSDLGDNNDIGKYERHQVLAGVAYRF